MTQDNGTMNLWRKTSIKTMTPYEDVAKMLMAQATMAQKV
jgi:hypothetical protein